MTNVIVIGAGPAGLMAAEMLADRGHDVLVVEAMPTVGRKLLMAGKSGLNLTKDEPFETFLAQYGAAKVWLEPMLKDFTNIEVSNWATTLGQDVFTGSSGRVFPKSMKASPLLRAWLARLDGKGVRFQTRSRWLGWQGDALAFETPSGPQVLSADATVLALGGASWARLGSDGLWADFLTGRGVEIMPFAPANMGFGVNWSSHMERHFGQPVKNTVLRAGTERVHSEFVVSAKGLEGSGIYAVSTRMRAGDPLYLDLVPNLPTEEVTKRVGRARGKTSLVNHLRKTLKLDPVKLALAQEFARPLPSGDAALAEVLKNLPVTHAGPRPLDEAISTAGGVSNIALDGDLMLTALPSVFCAGEMLDWEAPTGGYLLSACLATGRWAGLGAANYLDKTGEQQ